MKNAIHYFHNITLAFVKNFSSIIANNCLCNYHLSKCRMSIFLTSSLCNVLHQCSGKNTDDGGNDFIISSNLYRTNFINVYNY